MKIFINVASIIVLSLLTTLGYGRLDKQLQQRDIQWLADNLKLDYELVNVIKKGNCLISEKPGACYKVELSLTLPMAFHKPGWEIYFSQASPIQSVEHGNLSVSRISHGLNRVYPTKLFSGFEKQTTVRLFWTVKALTLKEVLLRPNFYIMSEGLKAAVIKSSLLK